LQEYKHIEALVSQTKVVTVSVHIAIARRRTYQLYDQRFFVDEMVVEKKKIEGCSKQKRGKRVGCLGREILVR